jgi:hypothetical protein
VSSFWAQRVGIQPQQQQAPAPPPASTRPWWQPQPVAPAPVVLTPEQMPAHEFPPAQQGSVAPEGEAHFGDLLRQDEYTTTKAQSAKDTETCPSCGSTNYVRASGHPNSMKRCFECGTNPRFEQMAAGTTGIPTKGPVRSARVQNPTVEGAPPMGTIFQHI